MTRLAFVTLLIIELSCKQHAEQTQKLSTSTASNDSLQPAYASYLQNIYDPQTGFINPSYNYSGKWDVDGDGKKDAVYFIGNGGAHIYFYLRVVLSSDGVVRDFPSAQVDMPFIETGTRLKEMGKNSAIQFAVADFNKDGIVDFYLNFDNHFGHLTEAWRKMGVRTRHVIMSFATRKLTVRDYK